MSSFVCAAPTTELVRKVAAVENLEGAKADIVADCQRTRKRYAPEYMKEPCFMIYMM